MMKPKLKKAAFYGLIGKAVKIIENKTEADSAGILIQLITCLGNALGRSVFIKIEETPHYANLYTLIVGETSKGRKGTSWGRAIQIMKQVDSDWFMKCRRSGIASGEGLICSLTNQNKDGETIITDKRYLIFEPEHASLMKKASREGSTLTTVLREAWDTDKLAVRTKNSPLSVEGVHVSKVSHITSIELTNLLRDVDIHNGLANRYLYVPTYRARILPLGAPLSDDESNELHAVCELLKAHLTSSRLKGEIKLSEAGLEYYRDFYHRLAGKETSELVATMTSRGEAYILRIALIFSAFDNSNEITEDHLMAAEAIWDFSQAAIPWIMQTETSNPMSDRILNHLRIGHSPTKTEIHRNIFKNNAKASDVNIALTVLEKMGLITKGEVGARTVYVLTKNELNEPNEFTESFKSYDSLNSSIRN